MYKIGALAGKFLPPQIGHLKLIKDAAQQCETLYVVMSDNPEASAELCRDAGLEPIPYRLRIEWLEEHFKDKGNIKFLYLDETGLPAFPDGTEQWSKKFKELIGCKIDAKFFGEEKYRRMNELYFPESEVVITRRGIDSPDVSATEVRHNLEKNLEHIIPEGRSYFENIIKNRKKNV